MFDNSEVAAGASVLARLESAADELAAVSLDAGTDKSVLELLRRLEIVQRRVAAHSLAVIAQAEQRGIPAAHGATSTANFLTRLLHLSASEARARVAAAEQLAPRQIAGQVFAPAYPQTATAHAAGEITAAHARITSSTLQTLPTRVTDEHFDDLEGQLVGWARQFGVDQFARLARHLGDVLDPDGVLRDERHRERTRDLTIRQRTDGSVCGTFEGTAELGEALLTILDHTAAPAPGVDGAKDARSPGQRRHDGLLDALTLLLRTGELGTTHGVTTTIIVTMTDQQLASGEGLARTGHGASIPVRSALKHLGDARIFPVTHTRGLSSGILATKPITAYGTAHRIFTEGQRLAMIARDQGCSFPACTVGPAWTEAHHITDWQTSKRTTVDDGALLCGHHHREHEKLGWRGQMIHGIPHWQAPRWIDPTRTWQPNTAHHTAALV